MFGVIERPSSKIRRIVAVFTHKGAARAAPVIIQYIFETWLPASNYELDEREQFEILPANYAP